MKVEVYSDVVCPWCYVGERRFWRAMEEFEGAEGVEVVYRPYQLDPAMPTEAIPLTQYLERRFGAGAASKRGALTESAAAEGLVMNWESALATNTRDAHRLMELALRQDGGATQHALAEELFALHFTHGGDLGDPEQLADAAGRAGMDRKLALNHLREGRGVAELEEEFERARGIGVRAVPTFVFEGQWAVEGAQSTETFLQVLRTVEERLTPANGAE